jgi:hypothetical protein
MTEMCTGTLDPYTYSVHWQLNSASTSCLSLSQYSHREKVLKIYSKEAAGGEVVPKECMAFPFLSYFQISNKVSGEESLLMANTVTLIYIHTRRHIHELDVLIPQKYFQ